MQAKNLLIIIQNPFSHRGPVLEKGGGEEIQRNLIRQILTYLIRNPDAKDTVDGVLQCWISKEMTEYRREHIEVALRMLVDKEWVTERSPTKSLFGLNHEKANEVGEFLKALQNQDKPGRDK